MLILSSLCRVAMLRTVYAPIRDRLFDRDKRAEPVGGRHSDIDRADSAVNIV